MSHPSSNQRTSHRKVTGFTVVITQCPAPKQLRRNWTNVYDPSLPRHDGTGEPISTRSADASDCDVFNDIAALEDSLIENYSTNLNGITIMTKATKLTAIADAILKADAKVHSTNNQGHTYFDPLDVIEDTIGMHADFHARVLNSLAWTIDTTCINRARDILFSRWEEVDEETVGFNEYCLGLVGDMKYSIEHSEFDEKLVTLCQLLTLREHWHDAAESAAHRNNRDYDPKSLHEQLIAEKPGNTSVATAVNFKEIAKFEAHGDEAAEQRLLAAYIQADTARLVQRSEGNKRMMPALMLVLHTAAAHKPTQVRFDQIPNEVQGRITRATIATIDRSKLDAARAMSSKPIEFGRVIESAFKATTRLNEIVASRFAERDITDNAEARPRKTRTANTL